MNCFPVGMEYFNASDESQWDVIKSLIDECDYYILIVAGRYGSIEESSGKSYTQKEYEYAISIGVPTIAFLHKDVPSLPKIKTETDPTVEQKLEAFKADVKKRLCRFWVSSGDLASEVVLSLHRLIKTKPRVGWVKADESASPEANAEIVKLRKEIDELKKRISHYEEDKPEGIENLAQGDDKIDLLFKTLFEGPEYMTETWNNIISLLAPHMYIECSEETLKESLNEYFRFSFMGGMGDWTILDDSFQCVKVQMIALGIIRESSRVHSASDKKAYWSLTPYGKKFLVTMGAIKRSSE